MYCGQCGAEIPSGQNHCIRCIGQTTPPPYPGSYAPQYVHQIYPNYPQGSFLGLFYGYIATNILYLASDFGKDVLKVFMDQQTPNELVGVLLVSIFLVSILVLISGISSVVYWGYLLFRCWALVQDSGCSRTTPGRAVGFCFIPFFNFYWNFVAKICLADEMNNYIRLRQIRAAGVNRNIAFLSCVYYLFSLFLVCFFVFGLMGAASFNPEFFEEHCTALTLSASVFGSIIAFVQVLIDAFLYRQFAETAEAIQYYKTSNWVGPPGGPPSFFDLRD